MSGGILNQMPFLRFLAPNATGYNRLLYVLNKLQTFLEKTILEHKTNLGEEANDLIDWYLKEMNSRVDVPSNESTFSGIIY